jgi:hypothetical protein
MPTPATDLDRIADDVTAILNERESKSQARQREAEVQHRVEAQRQAAEALKARQQQRLADELLLAQFGTKDRDLHVALASLEAELQSLPLEIAKVRVEINKNLFEMQAARERLG